MKSLQLPLCMNINCKPSTSSIPRKSTLLKSSDVCILCRTNTRHVCMISDGSGLHAHRVLKHCPVLAPVPVADLRSDRSQIQCPFRQTLGKHDKVTITNPRARPVESLLDSAVSLAFGSTICPHDVRGHLCVPLLEQKTFFKG